MSPHLWLLIALASLLLGTILAALVQSLRDLSRVRLEQIAEEAASPSGSARAAMILTDVEGHAAAVSLPRTAANLTAAIALVMWSAALRDQPAPGWVDVVAGAGGASLLLWLLGTVLPVSIAKHAGEALVYGWSPLLRVAYVLGRPLTKVAASIDELVRRLAGAADISPTQATQEVILDAVEEAKSEGAMDDQERDMIESVVTLRGKTVSQVMTPRTEVVAMEYTDDLSAITATIRSVRHSRIPVYEGSLDKVIGFFYVKDLMRWLAGEGARTGRAFSLRALLRPAVFVPESKPVRELLREMLARRTHITMVADEYGGSAGLITIEDIIEQVFGEIQDEFEVPQDVLTGVKVNAAQGTAEVDARAYIRDVNGALSTLGVELPESEAYDTVGGFVTVTLGRIPATGEEFAHDGMVVTVLGAEPTRVTRVRLRPRPEPAGEAPANP